MSENRSLPVLGTKEVFKPIKQSNLIIEKIEFVEIQNFDLFNIFEKLKEMGIVSDKWDVSDKQDGSIIAWKENDTLKISGNGTILANEDCEELFRGFNSLKSIKFNGLVDTSNMKNTCRMFWECESLEKVDVADWNTKNLENTFCMFFRCTNLEMVDVSNWNTQNLEDASWMFDSCESLENVDVSKWNTEKLQAVTGMFEKCRSLEYVDVSNWNTRSLKNASRMFFGCECLKNLDVANWNTQNLRIVSGMFEKCRSLKNVDFNGWNTQNLRIVSGMFEKGMFDGCFQLEKVITSCDKIISEINDKSIIQASKDCFVSDKMKLMQKGISIKPSQDKNSTTKEQTRSKNNQDISR